jgi:hypothetical protein
MSRFLGIVDTFGPGFWFWGALGIAYIVITAGAIIYLIVAVLAWLRNWIQGKP